MFLLLFGGGETDGGGPPSKRRGGCCRNQGDRLRERVSGGEWDPVPAQGPLRMQWDIPLLAHTQDLEQSSRQVGSVSRVILACSWCGVLSVVYTLAAPPLLGLCCR